MSGIAEHLQLVAQTILYYCIVLFGLLISIPVGITTVSLNAHCGMYIPLSDDKHRFVRDSSKKVHWKSETMFETKFILRQNLRIFFSNNLFFPRKSSQILFQTEFCLGLDFASDYIPQLYFVCNHLILLEMIPSHLVETIFHIQPSFFFILSMAYILFCFFKSQGTGCKYFL